MHEAAIQRFIAVLRPQQDLTPAARAGSALLSQSPNDGLVSTDEDEQPGRMTSPDPTRPARAPSSAKSSTSVGQSPSTQQLLLQLQEQVAWTSRNNIHPDTTPLLLSRARAAASQSQNSQASTSSRHRAGLAAEVEPQRLVFAEVGAAGDQQRGAASPESSPGAATPALHLPSAAPTVFKQASPGTLNRQQSQLLAREQAALAGATEEDLRAVALQSFSPPAAQQVSLGFVAAADPGPGNKRPRPLAMAPTPTHNSATSSLSSIGLSGLGVVPPQHTRSAPNIPAVRRAVSAPGPSAQPSQSGVALASSTVVQRAVVVIEEDDDWGDIDVDSIAAASVAPRSGSAYASGTQVAPAAVASAARSMSVPTRPSPQRTANAGMASAPVVAAPATAATQFESQFDDVLEGIDIDALVQGPSQLTRAVSVAISEVGDLLDDVWEVQAAVPRGPQPLLLKPGASATWQAYGDSRHSARPSWVPGVELPASDADIAEALGDPMPCHRWRCIRGVVQAAHARPSGGAVLLVRGWVPLGMLASLCELPTDSSAQVDQTVAIGTAIVCVHGSWLPPTHTDPHSLLGMVVHAIPAMLRDTRGLVQGEGQLVMCRGGLAAVQRAAPDFHLDPGLSAPTPTRLPAYFPEDAAAALNAPMLASAWGACHVSDTGGVLILEPHVLVSPTRVVSALKCARQAAFSELIGAIGAEASAPACQGNMQHAVFEWSLRCAQRFVREKQPGCRPLRLLRLGPSRYTELVRSPSSLDALRAAGIEPEVMREEIARSFQTMLRWLTQHVHDFACPAGCGLCAKYLSGRSSLHGDQFFTGQLHITQVIGTECTVIAPQWGLRGVFDGLVAVQAKPGQQLVLPLELKTGKVAAAVRLEHKAQLQLYAAMMSDTHLGSHCAHPHKRSPPRASHALSQHSSVTRAVSVTVGEELGHVHQASGVLVSIGKPAMQAPGAAGTVSTTALVAIAWQEFRDLIMRRNEVALDVAGLLPDPRASFAVRLPRPLPDDYACKYCDFKPVCIGVNAAMEDAPPPEWQLAAQAGMQSSTKEYMKQWWSALACEQLCDVEDLGAMSARHMQTWSGRGDKLATKGVGVGAEASSAAPHTTVPLPFWWRSHPLFAGPAMISKLPDAGSEMLEEEWRLTVSKSAAQSSPASGDISVGQDVVVSGLHGPWGVAYGEVVHVTTDDVSVRVMQPLHRLLPGIPSRGETDGGPGDLRTMLPPSGPPAMVRLDPREYGVSQKAPRSALLGATTLGLDEGGEAGSPVLDVLLRSAPASEAPRDHWITAFPHVASVLSDLNEQQRSAAAAALSGVPLVAVQGFPGSGKTGTIAKLVAAAQAMGKTVLLTSYTNTAVDGMLLRAERQGTQTCRVGRAAVVHPDLQHRLHAPDTDHDAHTAPVVGATVLGLRAGMLASRRFDIVVLDEAGQVPEPLALSAAMLARTLVLVGDSKQLPPLVRSKAAAAELLRVSLLSRAMSVWPQVVHTLSVQYRMNEEIQAFANVLMYEGMLKCGASGVADKRLHVASSARHGLAGGAWLKAITSASPSVVLVDSTPVAGQASAATAGQRSAPMEASMILIACSLLISCGVGPQRIGVIAPYRQQVQLLRRMWPEVGQCAGVEIDTIDRFQGSEKDCVFVTFVDGQQSGAQELGPLLQDVRRLNVAVTRAQVKLVLIGQRATLDKVPALQRALATLPPPAMCACSVPPGPDVLPWLPDEVVKSLRQVAAELS